jgi:hypothetical protein
VEGDEENPFVDSNNLIIIKLFLTISIGKEKVIKPYGMYLEYFSTSEV